MLSLLMICSSALHSRPSFFHNFNSLQIGMGINEFNSIPGTSFYTEYTRHIANIFFASARFAYSSASDDSPNAYYASQDMMTASLNLKINPIVTNQHIVSFRIGVNQNFYSCEGSYGRGTLATATGYAPYSKSTDGTGYSFGANYDYLFSRFYFVSIGATVVKYEQPVSYLSISIGTVF